MTFLEISLMHKLAYIIIVLATTAVVYFFFSAQKQQNTPPHMFGPYTAREMLESASVLIPGLDILVSLNNGRATFEKGEVRGTVELGNAFAMARSAEGADYLGYIIVNTGGSGTFRYLVLYSMTKQGLIHQDSAFLGDRVKVASIQTVTKPENEEYRVIVTILDRKPDEPMAAPPTVGRELTFTISGRQFIAGKK